MHNTPLAILQITLLGRAIAADALNEIVIDRLGAVRYRDAYLLEQPEGEAWLFDYGVLVTWGLSEDHRQYLLNILQEGVEDPLERVFSEQYRYEIDDANDAVKIRHDVLTLPNSDPLTRLALSHAFAQTAKLTFFEDRARDVLQENSFLSKDLARTGKISLSRTKLAKLRGVLFDTSSDITWNFGLLDTPEFFWDYPELEPYYGVLARYLDLQSRLTILNQKLSTIHEMLSMLAEEQRHKHSSFLEWIIIILIAVEIVMYFFPH